MCCMTRDKWKKAVLQYIFETNIRFIYFMYECCLGVCILGMEIVRYYPQNDFFLYFIHDPTKCIYHPLVSPTVTQVNIISRDIRRVLSPVSREFHLTRVDSTKILRKVRVLGNCREICYWNLYSW